MSDEELKRLLFLLDNDKLTVYGKRKLKKEIQRLRYKIMEIKEAISCWNLEYEEGKVDFEIPEKIVNVVWGKEVK